MAGVEPDSQNYCLTIEEWERKYILKPAPHLLSPKSSSSEERREKISCKNYPFLLFYFPKKHQKSDEEEEEKNWCHDHDLGYSSDDDDTDKEDDSPRRRKRKRKSMAKGFREFGSMVKRISGKIINFFRGAIRKKNKSLCY